MDPFSLVIGFTVGFICAIIVILLLRGLVYGTEKPSHDPPYIPPVPKHLRYTPPPPLHIPPIPPPNRTIKEGAEPETPEQSQAKWDKAKYNVTWAHLHELSAYYDSLSASDKENQELGMKYAERIRELCDELRVLEQTVGHSTKGGGNYKGAERPVIFRTNEGEPTEHQ